MLPKPLTCSTVALMAVSLIVAWVAQGFMPGKQAAALTLGVLCIGLWASAALPEYLTALAFFVLAMLLKVAPSQVVFSGFHSSTFWLLFGGLVLGAAIRHTGLDQRLAGTLAGMLGRRYASVIAGIVVFGVAMSFLIPSSIGRAVLLIPIVLSLADRLGYGPSSQGRTGMLLAGAFGTHVPAFAILPSNVPNMILAGTAETLYGHAPTYWEYLRLHFPVLGVLKSGVLILLILCLFPDRAPCNDVGVDQASPFSPTQKRLMWIIALCLVLWLTDAVHHVSPAWVSLAAAVYCLWPGSGLTSQRCINEHINHGSLFFVAGVMGVGAMVSSTGLGAMLVNAASAHAGLAVDSPWQNVTALTLISTLVAMLTTLPGVPAVMTPMADVLANASGLPVASVLMTQVLGFSNVLLPYQSPPLLVAIQLGHISATAATKLCVALFAITLLVLTPLDMLWWHVLGWL